MSVYKDQPRPDRARHRAQPAANESTTREKARENKSRSVLAKAAKSQDIGQRMAVVAAGVALLMGVGSAGHAAEQALSAKDTATQVAAARSASASSSAPIKAWTTATAEPAVPLETKAPAPAPSATPAPAATPAPSAAAAAPEPAAVAPAAAPVAPVAVDDPAAAQAYAASRLSAYGWGPEQMQSLITLWERESNWRTTAVNASSGAYGIVQSLPGSKMASVGADWETNFRTQIEWGLNYIKERYGSPANALSFHYANNWY